MRSLLIGAVLAACVLVHPAGAGVVVVELVGKRGVN